MNLTEKETQLMELMAKRIGFSEFRQCAETDDQAYDMRDAFQQVVEQIHDQEQQVT